MRNNKYICFQISYCDKWIVKQTKRWVLFWKCLNILFSFNINSGCKKSSVYGTACDIHCPVACKNSTCHIQNGKCLGCEPGVYGSYCNLSCPTNCKDNTCHTQNGTCYTCKPGWTGINCKTSNCSTIYEIKIWIPCFLVLFCYH